MTKDIPKNILIEKLVNNKEYIIDVARYFNVSKHTIIKKCKKYDIYGEVKTARRDRFDKGKRNLLGKKFGKLKVVKKGSNDKHGKTRWVCLCECGNEKLINSSSLIKGLSKTCGCVRENFKGYKDISGSFWRRTRDSAIKRDLDFNITMKYVWNLYIKQNQKCAITNIPIYFLKNQDDTLNQTASIDRINSKKGYIKKNVQIIHRRLNRIKGVLSNEELLMWSKIIYLNNKEFCDNLDIDLQYKRSND